MIDSQSGLQILVLNSGQNDVIIEQTVTWDITQGGGTASVTFSMAEEATGLPVITGANANYSILEANSTLAFSGMPDTSGLSGRYRAQFNVILPDGARHTTDQFLIIFNNLR
jgi:hypothetical protein